MAWDTGDSNADLRRDIERWEKDLAMLEAEGLGGSSAADRIRAWIAEARDLIADFGHSLPRRPHG
jgi:hypothetical protein